MTPKDEERLTVERITQARETLTAAFAYAREENFPGARDQHDAAGVFAEAKRNLAALLLDKHGREPWEKMLDED